MDPYAAVPEVRRVRWLARAGILWAVIILVRLVHFQVIKHEEFLRLATAQQEHDYEIGAPRGTIRDRAGRALVMSVRVDSLAVNPRKISEPEMVAELLSRHLSLNPKLLCRSIKDAQKDPKRRGFLWIKRKLSSEESASLRGYRYEWMDWREESRRIYLHEDLAAPLIGFVNDEEIGVAGVEQAFNRDLEGIPGRIKVLNDGSQLGVDTLEIDPPVPGADVALTIDYQLQYFCDETLKQAAREHNARGGVIVVMDPRTGDILAMSSVPGYHPASRLRPGEQRVNRAVSATHDAGSVFKAYVIAAALETTSLRASSPIYCGGTYRVGNHVIGEAGHAFGTLTLEQVFWFSSNMGAIQIGNTVGKEKLWPYLRNFGFGQPTGVGLPGEAPGILKPLPDWKPSTISFVSIGHEVTVTTLQLAQACSVFAADGMRVKPRLWKWRQRPDEGREMAPPSPAQRVLRAETAAEIRRISEGVLLSGTGKRARLDGFIAGGKTGTAQVLDPATGKYIKLYDSTFMGYAPLNRPEVVVVATLNGVKGFGGVVAAPIFRAVASEALRLRGTPMDIRPAEVTPPPAPAEIANQQSPAAPAAPETAAVEERGAIWEHRVPDFQGLAKRQVLMLARARGMKIAPEGRGVARRQWPAPGEPLKMGVPVRVVFEQ